MRIEHAALYVKDLERAKGFFETYFGATANNLYHNPTTGFSSYFLSFPDGPRLEIMTKPGVEDPSGGRERLGFAHVAFSVDDKAAVDELTRRLKEDGYEVVSGPRTTGDGYYESCVLDAEGNRMEITC